MTLPLLDRIKKHGTPMWLESATDIDEARRLATRGLIKIADRKPSKGHNHYGEQPPILVKGVL